MAGPLAKPPKEELTQQEFAAMLGCTVGHVRNMEGGYGMPGREHLEAAAKAAGFSFEDCIQIPGGVQFRNEKQIALAAFIEALNDDERERGAVLAAFGLERQQKERRPKTGGRTRKTSPPSRE